MARTIRTLCATIRGQVQGLGFRPYVYRLAARYGVTGSVGNSSCGVEIVAQGTRAREFLDRLAAQPPPLARITGMTVTARRITQLTDFLITGSTDGAATTIDVLPDIATCADCAAEIADPADRRFRYPFTNCTQCGPRYTIIQELPYDRPRTTMHRFEMCPDCLREYTAPADRRFHAQPNACPVCGPQLALLDRAGRPMTGDPLDRAADALARGRIVAIKSLGGYQLACDARNETAVARLRRRKRRPDKPLALMCPDIATVARYCRVSRASRELLRSPAAPIVLLPRRPRVKPGIPGNVAPGTHRLGVMLAYTPLHQLLLGAVRARTRTAPALVMTSANHSEEPIIADRAELYRELGRVFDLCLDHDRPIANRCDDSVVMAGDPERAPLFIRRARGYAPQPILLGPTFHVKQPVLALGGELRGCFCLAKGDHAWLSPHIGSLESAGSERFFSSTLDRYRRWTGVEPALVACDLHPDYLSTRLAERLAARLAVPLVRVQHHLAHALSVMAEHGIPGPALAIGLDGTGYGTDGRIWGCELLVVRPDRSWTRVGHLGELALVEAGDALPDPSRVAAGFLEQALGRVPPGLGLARSFRSAGARVAAGRPVLTSSLGRLFDAVAAITGACRHATFEGQAPAALEALADPRAHGGWPVRPARGPSGEWVIDPCPILNRVAGEMLDGVDPSLVAARFHETVCRGLARMAIAACREHGIGTAVISGGSLANTLLRNRLPGLLRRAGLAVRRNELVPANDGGIPLGQAVAAGR